MFALCFLSAGVVFAQDGGLTKRVEFEENKPSVRFEEKVDLMNSHRYLMSLREGQELTIKLKGKQIHLSLIAPSEKTLVKLEGQSKAKTVSEIAKERGDYLLLVQCFCKGFPKYKLDITAK